MNKKMVFYMVGRILILEALLLLLPTICSAIYREECIYSFLITILVALLCGGFLVIISKTKDRAIYAKEGFSIVALAWIALSAIGALPFYISGEIPSYIDAFFETVSGITTTGASIVQDVEKMSHGILFWRSFTHFIGGMGVLVLIMAVFPTDTGRSMYIMRAEMPGPIIGKFVPKIKSTAKILYLIYTVLTSTEIILLFVGGMPLFDSFIYGFGTAGTGGFAIRSDGLASYSTYSQWVITAFMLIFGVNFNIYYLILVKKGRLALKSEELWTYIIIVLVSVTIITFNIYPESVDLSEAIRESAFQVSSIITTTGFSTTDFNLWSSLSKGILLVLMFFGACAGSTAGGLKISRVVLIFKTVKANLKHAIHTRSVEAIRFEGKTVDGQTIKDVTSYLAVYCICLICIFLIICIDPFDLETHISAAVSCFNNIGPGFSAVGPLSSYAGYSNLSKLTLSAAMLLGRLEILPILLLFAPSSKRKNR